MVVVVIIVAVAVVVVVFVQRMHIKNIRIIMIFFLLHSTMRMADRCMIERDIHRERQRVHTLVVNFL